jgi:hypothetical protein
MQIRSVKLRDCFVPRNDGWAIFLNFEFSLLT